MRFSLQLHKLKHISYKDFERLKWLSVTYRFKQCVNVIVFKYFNEQCPNSLRIFIFLHKNEDTSFCKIVLCHRANSKSVFLFMLVFKRHLIFWINLILSYLIVKLFSLINKYLISYICPIYFQISDTRWNFKLKKGNRTLRTIQKNPTFI